MEEKYSNKPTTHSVVCPQCRNLISYYDYPRSNHFGCPECSCFFRHNSNGTNAIIRTFQKENKVTPDFPFGTKLKNNTLVAVVSKRDPREDFWWTEYLFAQPESDYYVTLADVDGYWMLTVRDPSGEHYNNQKTYNGAFATPLVSYQFEVMYAEGEFNWDICNDEKLTTNEFISNENVLINEFGNSQSDWYKGVFVYPADLATRLSVPMQNLSPRRFFNPKTFYPAWKHMPKTATIFTGCFMLIAFVMSMMNPEKTVYSGEYACVQDTAAWNATTATIFPAVTPNFHISSRGRARVSVTANGLDNNWLELEFSMVNNKTGEEFEGDKTIEYYHGYSDGESWSEGSNNDDITFSGVPEGEYHLNIYPTAPPETIKNRDGTLGNGYSVSVAQSSNLTANFIFTLLLLLGYPIIQFYRKKTYEQKARNTKIYGDLAPAAK